MQKSNFIAGEWVAGKGDTIVSINPADAKDIWSGAAADSKQADAAVTAAQNAFLKWSLQTVEQRAAILEKFGQQLEQQKDGLAQVLAQETGKPLWESKTEIAAMLGKLAISKQAYADRCKEASSINNDIKAITRHRPHGVVVVIGPFNFPGHIPNGHIIPALLAGNTVILKPSELTPYFSTQIMQCWQAAGLPAGVINLVQGGADISQYLTEHSLVSGVFFTGSSHVGLQIQKSILEVPQRILALEMGGNNPLVVHNPESIDAAVYHTIHSAFITAGQRCTCARRLIMVKNKKHEKFLQRLISVVDKIQVGSYMDDPEPFMGPVISNAAADRLMAQYSDVINLGAEVLLPLQRLDPATAFIKPGIIDVTAATMHKDQEAFGPLLTVIWVEDFAEAITEANNTSFGLSAGIIAQNRADYERFYTQVRAGLINWNRPLTGASSSAPFGGVGKSGNYRPSAYYAADYCVYPVASMEQQQMQLPEKLSPGITL